MEDTKSLLMMVLQKVFHNRPKIVEETFQLIYNYNNGKREKREYEQTLKTICDLMNGELSSQILVYLLTMVDMPREGGCQLPIMEKMQKTHGCLAESVRPHLLECLKNKKTEFDETGKALEKNKGLCCTKKMEEKKDLKCPRRENAIKKSSSSDDDTSPKLVKRPRKLKKRRRKRGHLQHSEDHSESKTIETLTQICATYCTKNEAKLKKLYKTKLNSAWGLLYMKVLDESTMKKIYEVIKYLNRMLKLVRMVENSEVTIELMEEEYPDIEVLARLRYPQEFINPFDQFDRYMETSDED